MVQRTVLLSSALALASATASAAEQLATTPNILIDPPVSDAGLTPLPTLPALPPGPASAPADAGATSGSAPVVQPEPTPAVPAASAAPPPEPSSIEHVRPQKRDRQMSHLRGASFGLGLAYGLPWGMVQTSASPLSEVGEINGVASARVASGYFLNEHLYVGGLFSAGLVPVVNICTNSMFATDVNTTCSAFQIRMDVEAEWHFTPRASSDWWAGGGIGYEILHVSSNGATGVTSDDTSAGYIAGMELKVMGGLDVKPVSPLWAIGPFVELSAGHYWYEPFAVHGFLTFGARVRSQL